MQSPRDHLSWIAFKRSKWILGISSAFALATSLLMNVQEVFPLGQEIGYFLSALAFAYLGAWIFHWVIVEIPQQYQYDSIYSSAHESLAGLARGGDEIVTQLEPLAFGWTEGRPEDVSEMDRFFARVQLGNQRNRYNSEPMNPAIVVRWRIGLHQEALKQLSPFFHLLHPEVATVLMEMSTRPWYDVVESIPMEPEVSSSGVTLTGFKSDGSPIFGPREGAATVHEACGSALSQHVILCWRLGWALEKAWPTRFTPPLGGGISWVGQIGMPEPFSGAAEIRSSGTAPAPGDDD